MGDDVPRLKGLDVKMIHTCFLEIITNSTCPGIIHIRKFRLNLSVKMKKRKNRSNTHSTLPIRSLLERWSFVKPRPGAQWT